MQHAARAARQEPLRCISGVEGAPRIVRFCAVCAPAEFDALYVQGGKPTKQFKTKADRNKGYVRPRA
eukprot:8243959-Lingulodinium_polyedra.AAC.1